MPIGRDHSDNLSNMCCIFHNNRPMKYISKHYEIQEYSKYVIHMCIITHDHKLNIDTIHNNE